jgi:rhomboid protease GluP
MSGIFGRGRQSRPQVCPACRALVGVGATHCHQCGANLRFSLAAASRSLGGLMPAQSPATYGILGLSCLFFVISLLTTLRSTGFVSRGGGGLSGLFNFGAISGGVLERFGASLPLPYNLAQPWRFVMAIFLHGSVLHIFFNMWVLMDIGPQIEELYGSARYFFIYIVTGIGGYVVSSATGHMSVGGSGALLGLIGILLAVTTSRKTAGMQMLRNQMIRWLIYIAVWGLLFPGIDNFAHAGGLISGFLLGKIMADRLPASPQEQKRAYALGWGAAFIVAASIALMILANVRASAPAQAGMAYCPVCSSRETTML